jgi:hypothetical protein
MQPDRIYRRVVPYSILGQDFKDPWFIVIDRKRRSAEADHFAAHQRFENIEGSLQIFFKRPGTTMLHNDVRVSMSRHLMAGRSQVDDEPGTFFCYPPQYEKRGTNLVVFQQGQNSSGIGFDSQLLCWPLFEGKNFRQVKKRFPSGTDFLTAVLTA